MHLIKHKLNHTDFTGLKDIINAAAFYQLQDTGFVYFDTLIYLADIDGKIIYPSEIREPASNAIIEDIFLDKTIYQKYMDKNIVERHAQSPCIICETTGIALSVYPIFFAGKYLGCILFASNTKCRMDEIKISDVCKNLGKKPGPYLRELGGLKAFNADKFTLCTRIIKSALDTATGGDDKITAITNDRNMAFRLLASIVRSESISDMIHQLTEDLFTYFNTDNVSIAIKSLDNADIHFAQRSANGLMFREDKLFRHFREQGMFQKGQDKTIQSYLTLPESAIRIYYISSGQDILGYVSIASKKGLAMDYTIEGLLHDVIKICSYIYLSKYNSFKLRQATNSLYEILENIDISVNVKDKFTGKLLYGNQRYFDEESLDRPDAFPLFPGENDLVSHEKSSLVRDEYFSPKQERWFFSNTVSTDWIEGSRSLVEFRIDITDNKHREETIQTLIWRNKLSNLPNRAKLNKDLSELLNHSDNSGYIIIMNLDLFGHINDSSGYEFGDRLILELVNFLRSMDDDILLYHLVGAEFVLVCYAPDQINQILTRIRDRFKEPWFVDEVEQYCTCSMGVAAYPKDGIFPEQLIKNANLALKMAKRDGRNKTCYFDALEDDKFARSLQIEYYLRHAVMKHMEYFTVYYQPLISAKNGEVVAMEALIRWFDPEIGFVSPTEFIELAESLGIIGKIDNYVLDKACRFANRLHKEGHDNLRLSTNISARQLFEDGIVDTILNTVRQTGFSSRHINLEITETAAMYDLDKAIKKLSQLKSHGFSISLDDFGIGYSSLSTLKNLPINTVKIDKLFIADMHKTQYNYTFIKTIIELAHSADLAVCCEGVEREREYRELINLKCDMLQGFLFGRPMPEHEFLDYLQWYRPLGKS